MLAWDRVGTALKLYFAACLWVQSSVLSCPVDFVKSETFGIGARLPLTQKTLPSIDVREYVFWFSEVFSRPRKPRDTCDSMGKLIILDFKAFSFFIFFDNFLKDYVLT